MFPVCFTMVSATSQKNLLTSRLEWPFTSPPVFSASKKYAPLVQKAGAPKTCIPSALELRLSLRRRRKSSFRVRGAKSKVVSRCKTQCFDHIVDPKWPFRVRGAKVPLFSARKNEVKCDFFVLRGLVFFARMRSTLSLAFAPLVRKCTLRVQILIPLRRGECDVRFTS